MSTILPEDMKETEECILCGRGVVMCFGRSCPICDHCEQWSSEKELRLAQHIHNLRVTLTELINATL